MNSETLLVWLSLSIDSGLLIVIYKKVYYFTYSESVPQIMITQKVFVPSIWSPLATLQGKHVIVLDVILPSQIHGHPRALYCKLEGQKKSFTLTNVEVNLFDSSSLIPILENSYFLPGNIAIKQMFLLSLFILINCSFCILGDRSSAEQVLLYHVGIHFLNKIQEDGGDWGVEGILDIEVTGPSFLIKVNSVGILGLGRK